MARQPDPIPMEIDQEPARRSGRSRRGPISYNEDFLEQQAPSPLRSPPTQEPQKATERRTRTPVNAISKKRKPGSTEFDGDDDSSDDSELMKELDTTLLPLPEDELSQWGGWVEIESDPVGIGLEPPFYMKNEPLRS